MLKSAILHLNSQFFIDFLMYGRLEHARFTTDCCPGITDQTVSVSLRWNSINACLLTWYDIWKKTLHKVISAIARYCVNTTILPLVYTLAIPYLILNCLNLKTRRPLPQFKDDPRAFLQASKEMQQQASPLPYHRQQHHHHRHHGGSPGPLRAPPPAHSNHLNASHSDIRSARDRKSPVAAAAKGYGDPPFGMYDGKANSADNR